MAGNQNSLLKSAIPPLLYLLVIWVIFYVNEHFKLDLAAFGLRPRNLPGLIGILTMPLLHSDLPHIASNSVPLLVLGICLFQYYREIAYKVFFISYFASGILVWLFAANPGHNSVHIGASGLIYALAGFLFFSGFLRRDKVLFGITLLITFLYGTIIWGIFPEEFQIAIRYSEKARNISWEGHLFGFLSGTALAYIYRRVGPQRPKYSWEINNDEDVDESDPYWMVDEESDTNEKKDDILKNTSDNPYTVHYTFIPKKTEDDKI
jgi:membrane associated rhomboid family serine protease